MEMDSLQSLIPSSLPMALFFIIPLLLLMGLITRIRRNLPYPPGPKGLPIVGNMSMVDQLTHRGLAKLAKQYGGLFYMKFGFLHTITVSSPEMAREVLQVQDVVFSNRPAPITTHYLTYDRADMAFAHYGPFWRQMRKICVTKLFSRKRAESWESVRDEVDSMVKAVASNVGSAVNVGELIFTLTMNVTYRAAFGSKNEGQEEFIKILQEFSKLFGAFNMADFIPWVRWFDPQNLNKRLVKARLSLDKFIDKIIDDHVEKNKREKTEGGGDEGKITDMVDDLLDFYGEEAKVNGGANQQNSINLTKDNIKALIMDVMFGGTETVASAIEWALSELMRSPEDLKRVQQELADVVGLDRRVEESDIEKLTFLNCTMKETLRLHPPIPLLLHETAKATEIAGYYIPAQTRVMINAFAIGRDPNHWEDPDTFRPSRFLKEGVPDFKGSNFEYIPFGSGRRSCPGMQLGLYSLELALANLLHCFKWELPDGMKPSEVDVTDIFGLTAPKESRLIAVPTRRLVCPLF
ncbi:cytochrome P450 84A1-like [Tripterygium wilfordii]|uniref:Cytochrome P450 84A1-like n=1 Tax=Tripterygium wilfordii TaxID=458696 RepID=A0A7J7CPG9_TRIWF|nr:cytochrome P450 84A1-like [Tripterygium wilfordii]KAF5735980.1 cytochrome P450 84A1-like [Tripterygium wilfordii]